MANAKCRVWKELGIRRAGRVPGPSTGSVTQSLSVSPWAQGSSGRGDGLCGREWTGVDEAGSASVPAAREPGGNGPGAGKGSPGPTEAVRAGRSRGGPGGGGGK